MASTASPRAKKGKKTAKGGKRKAPFAVEVYGLTDVGLVREGNEDALLIFEDEGLYAVADGMGGHNCGEVASAFTIEALSSFYKSPELRERIRLAHRKMDKAHREVSHHALRLRKAVESANLSVHSLAKQHESLKDMGTTVVATVLLGKRMYVSNVGDSRLYRMRGSKLQQLTEDHSLVNEYLKMNMLKPEDVESFPYKNVIVRAIGLHERVTVDLSYAMVDVGDQVLLCTDGLTDLVKDPELADVLEEAASAREACEKLVELAKARGGHDNITAVVLRLHAAA